MIKSIATSFLVLLLLTGCALFQDNPNLARASIEYGTLKVIDGDAARADRIVALMDDLIVLTSDDAEATVALLYDRLEEQIDWSKLDMADTILVSAVMQEVRGQLEAQISDGLLDPDTRLVVSETLGWIRGIASRYGG